MIFHSYNDFSSCIDHLIRVKYAIHSLYIRSEMDYEQVRASSSSATAGGFGRKIMNQSHQATDLMALVVIGFFVMREIPQNYPV